MQKTQRFVLPLLVLWKRLSHSPPPSPHKYHPSFCSDISRRTKMHLCDEMLFTLKFLLFKQENGRANFSSIANAKKMNKHLINQLTNWRKIKVFQFCWRKYHRQMGDNTTYTHTVMSQVSIWAGICAIFHHIQMPIYPKLCIVHIACCRTYFSFSSGKRKIIR